MAHELIEYFAARQSETVALLRQLVELESPSESKPALDRLGHSSRRNCATWARASRSCRRPRRAIISWRRLVADATPRSPIVTLCHIDTVWPLGTLAKMPWREEDGQAARAGRV